MNSDPSKQDPTKHSSCSISDLSAIESLVIVIGVSGAGKSLAIDALSDLGFFTVENLPVPLFQQFLNFIGSEPARFSKVALTLDIDSRDKQAVLFEMLKLATPRPGRLQVIFLDCKTETIVKRYGQTRRPHPGFNPEKDKTLEEAIEREKNRLFPLREISNLVIDTTERNVHDLRREIKSFAESVASGIKRPLRINFLSFGFKHGVPIDCDLVVDVRFLPNPFFVEGLSNKTGHETEVIEYVMRNQAAGEFVTRYLDMLAYLIPLYANSGKPYLNIGVGCTGGRHRSVVLAEALASEMLKKAGERQHFVSVKHRDLDKPQ